MHAVGAQHAPGGDLRGRRGERLLDRRALRRPPAAPANGRPAWPRICSHAARHRSHQRYCTASRHYILYSDCVAGSDLLHLHFFSSSFILSSLFSSLLSHFLWVPQVVCARDYLSRHAMSSVAHWNTSRKQERGTVLHSARSCISDVPMRDVLIVRVFVRR